MGAASTVLRILSDFGDAAGWLIAAVVLFAYGRRIIRENEKAHAAITENVRELDKKIDTVAAGLDKKIDTVAAGLDKKIDTVAAGLDKKIDTVAAGLDKKIDIVAAGLDKKIDALDTKIDTVAAKIDAVANDVAFLAGRRAERDRG